MRIAGPRLKTVDTRTCRPPPKVADPLYTSPEWRALVAALIRARGRRCEQCGRTHGADGVPVRVFADHIVELKDGGAPFDPRNLRILCGSCHGVKTARERAKRR